MVVVAVKFRIVFSVKNGVENGKLRNLFALEVSRIVKNFAVAVSENVGREPAVEAEHSEFESGSDYRLHQGLTGLPVFSCDRHLHLVCEFLDRSVVNCAVRRTVDVGKAHAECCISVNLTRSDFRMETVFHSLFEISERVVDLARFVVSFGRSVPNHDSS